MFLDRDGVLNDLEYDEEEGRVGSPLSARELKVFPYAGEAVRRIKALGFLAIVVSNQPGVAKRQFSLEELDRMNTKVRSALASRGGKLDAEYYCLHHPEARVKKYRLDCDCRKPKPGLLLRAAKEQGVDLASSYLVGDALVDVKAGRAAGCTTILLGHAGSFLSELIDREGAAPDHMLPSLKQVPDLIVRLESAPSVPPSGRRRLSRSQ